jgi:hypothetical protein
MQVQQNNLKFPHIISRQLVRFSVDISDGSASSHCGPQASQPQNASEKFQYSSAGYNRCVQFLLCKGAENEYRRDRLHSWEICTAVNSKQKMVVKGGFIWIKV